MYIGYWRSWPDPSFDEPKTMWVMALGSHVSVLWSLSLSCERYQTITVWMDPFRVAELHVPLWPCLPIIRTLCQPAHQEAVKSQNMARANSSCGLGMISTGVMKKKTFVFAFTLFWEPSVGCTYELLEPVHSKIQCILFFTKGFSFVKSGCEKYFEIFLKGFWMYVFFCFRNISLRFCLGTFRFCLVEYQDTKLREIFWNISLMVLDVHYLVCPKYFSKVLYGYVCFP